MKKKNEFKLRKKYPQLFEGMEEDIRCDDGWRYLIDAACQALAVHENPPHFRCIKEKFGKLRIYLEVGDIYMQRGEVFLSILERTEELSSMTCESCGVAGELRKDPSPWKTLCKKCHNKRRKKNAQKIPRGSHIKK